MKVVYLIYETPAGKWRVEWKLTQEQETVMWFIAFQGKPSGEFRSRSRLVKKCKRYADLVCREVTKSRTDKREAARLRAQGQLVEQGCDNDSSSS